ncbi:MAG: hypothetical protein KGL73_03770 [Burkholderiales bacterium]|nr:hypothetical protein [Burkholderiales bacterium]
MKVIALSGSLCAASIHTALLRAAAKLAPQGMQIEVFGGISDLPLFKSIWRPRCPAMGPPCARLFTVQTP